MKVCAKGVGLLMISFERRFTWFISEKLKTFDVPILNEAALDCRLFVSTAGHSILLAQKNDRPPNIVFILIDDMGWKDLGCMGSQYYQTPHIDALAKEGVLFEQAYACAPVCSPSRGAILSGKFPGRTAFTNVFWNDHDAR